MSKLKLASADQRDEMIQESKIYALIAPTILPLLAQRKANAHGRLIQGYRSGKYDNLTIVAELAVLADLENEIKQKTLLYDTLTGELT